MTEGILPHGISKFCFWSSENTKLLFRSWCNVENDNNFHKITAGTFAEKNGMRQCYFEIQFYGNNTGDFFSHISFHLCRDHLKLFANFEQINILGQCFWRILVNRAFHLNSDWNFVMLTI